MKRIFVFIVVLSNVYLLTAQTAATIEPFNSTIYKCLNGPVSIIGYDATKVYAHGSCYDKKEDVEFDANTFEYIGPVSHPENSSSYIPFVAIEYSDSNPNSPSLLKSKLDGSKYGTGWKIQSLTLADEASETGEYFGIEMGNKSTMAANFGIAVTKYNSTGKILWSNIYARTLIGYNTFVTTPLVVQRSGYMYLFYVDREPNYDTQFFNDVHFGGSFAAMSLKYDLICQKINITTGVAEKFLVGRKPASKGLYFLYQALELEDGSFAILGFAKGVHTYAWYHLKIQ